MASRYLLFVLALLFSAALACRSSPLPIGDGGGGAGGSGGGGGSGGSGGAGGSGGEDIARVCVASSTCSRCPDGPCCGTSCCGSGEWCDPATLTCRCGDGAACTGGNMCATGPVVPGQTCGTICCGVTSFCPA